MSRPKWLAVGKQSNNYETRSLLTPSCRLSPSSRIEQQQQDRERSLMENKNMKMISEGELQWDKYGDVEVRRYVDGQYWQEDEDNWGKRGLLKQSSDKVVFSGMKQHGGMDVREAKWKKGEGLVVGQWQMLNKSKEDKLQGDSARSNVKSELARSQQVGEQSFVIQEQDIVGVQKSGMQIDRLEESVRESVGLDSSVGQSEIIEALSFVDDGHHERQLGYPEQQIGGLSVGGRQRDSQTVFLTMSKNSDQPSSYRMRINLSKQHLIADDFPGDRNMTNIDMGLNKDKKMHLQIQQRLQRKERLLKKLRYRLREMGEWVNEVKVIKETICEEIKLSRTGGKMEVFNWERIKEGQFVNDLQKALRKWMNEKANILIQGRQFLCQRESIDKIDYGGQHKLQIRSQVLSLSIEGQPQQQRDMVDKQELMRSLICQKESLQEEVFTLQQKLVGTEMQIEHRVRQQLQQLQPLIEERLKLQARSQQKDKIKCYLQTIDTLSKQISELSGKCQHYEAYIMEQERQKQGENNFGEHVRQCEEMLVRRVREVQMREESLVQVENQLIQMDKRLKQVQMKLNKEAFSLQKKQNTLSMRQGDMERILSEVRRKEEMFGDWERRLKQEEKRLFQQERRVNRWVKQVERQRAVWRQEKEREKLNIIERKQTASYHNNKEVATKYHKHGQGQENKERYIVKNKESASQQMRLPSYRSSQIVQFNRSFQQTPYLSYRERGSGEVLYRQDGGGQLRDRGQDIRDYRPMGSGEIRRFNAESIKPDDGNSVGSNFNHKARDVPRQIHSDTLNSHYLSTLSRSELAAEVLSRHGLQANLSSVNNYNKQPLVSGDFTKSQVYSTTNHRSRSPFNQNKNSYHHRYKNINGSEEVRKMGSFKYQPRMVQKPSKDLPNSSGYQLNSLTPKEASKKRVSFNNPINQPQSKQPSYGSRTFAKSNVAAFGISEKLEKLKEEIKREVRQLQ